MGRKHRRHDWHQPLDIPPTDPIHYPADGIRTLSDAEYAAARRARVSAAIDWDHCCVAGCGKTVRIHREVRDVDIRLPICAYHAVIIKRQIEPHWDDEGLLALRHEYQQAKEQRRDGRRRAVAIDSNGGSSKGQIYFVRLNGLVKVGWSAELVKRLKAYGPDVEILCHYPASRQDETLMHRQLKPYLAKGREWFEDCKVVADIVETIIAEHGPPSLSAAWTAPKGTAAKPRRWSA